MTHTPMYLLSGCLLTVPCAACILFLISAFFEAEAVKGVEQNFVLKWKMLCVRERGEFGNHDSFFKDCSEEWGRLENI